MDKSTLTGSRNRKRSRRAIESEESSVEDSQVVPEATRRGKKQEAVAGVESDTAQPTDVDGGAAADIAGMVAAEGTSVAPTAPAAAAAAVVSDKMVPRDNGKRKDAEGKARKGTAAAAAAAVLDRMVPRDTRKRKVSKLTTKPTSSSQGPVLHFLPFIVGSLVRYYLSLALRRFTVTTIYNNLSPMLGRRPVGKLRLQRTLR